MGVAISLEVSDVVVLAQTARGKSTTLATAIRTTDARNLAVGEGIRKRTAEKGYAANAARRCTCDLCECRGSDTRCQVSPRRRRLNTISLDLHDGIANTRSLTKVLPEQSQKS